VALALAIKELCENDVVIREALRRCERASPRQPPRHTNRSETTHPRCLASRHGHTAVTTNRVPSAGHALWSSLPDVPVQVPPTRNLMVSRLRHVVVTVQLRQVVVTVSTGFRFSCSRRISPLPKLRSALSDSSNDLRDAAGVEHRMRCSNFSIFVDTSFHVSLGCDFV
jgi:hypothetical protein